jgi:non-specific serine/threonine protein kinase
MHEECRRLEGMPLAIELAASRLALLPPAQVARMLDDALSVLTAADGPPRQRTLRAALDWSYELLPEEDRQTFRVLSVFAASCTLAAAAVMLDDSEAATLDRLAALRDRSLLVAETGGQVARFRLLEPIRQYALDQLRRHGEENEARRRHAIWVLTAVEELAPQFFGGEQQRAVAAFRELVSDVQGAFGWALSHETRWAARTASATAWAWDLVGHLTEGDRLLRASLEAQPNDQELTRILGGLSVLAGRRGDEHRLDYAARAVAAGRARGDTPELGYALFALAPALNERGRRKEAEAAFDEAHDLAQRSGDRLLRAWVDAMRTNPLIASSDVALARRAWEAAISVAGEVGDIHGQGIALGNLASMCLEMRDHVAGRRALRQALTLLEQHRNWAMSAQLLGFAARLASRHGRFREALRLFGAERRLRALVDRPIEPIGAEEELSRLQLSHAEVEAALTEGAALTVREMFAGARREAERSDAVERGGLSDRELEVSRLVARGLSNKEIAGRLRRSERTVENHVQHVLAKLDFHSRAQVGAWAQEHGLLD